MTKEDLIKAIERTGGEKTKECEKLLKTIKDLKSRINDLVDLLHCVEKNHLEKSIFTLGKCGSSIKVIDRGIYFNYRDSSFLRDMSNCFTDYELFVDKNGDCYRSNYSYDFKNDKYCDTFFVKPSIYGDKLEYQIRVLRETIHLFKELEEQVYTELEKLAQRE